MKNECPFCNVEHAVGVPTIHTNGTAPEDLRDQLDSAVGAVQTALVQVAAAAPNPRDYYLSGGCSWHTASAQHADRMNRLRDVLAELDQIRAHVYEVIGFRAEQRANR